MYSAYKLNKQGDNIQPGRTPFPIWNQSVVHVRFYLLLPDLHTGFLTLEMRPNLQCRQTLFDSHESEVLRLPSQIQSQQVMINR